MTAFLPWSLAVLHLTPRSLAPPRPHPHPEEGPMTTAHLLAEEEAALRAWLSFLSSTAYSSPDGIPLDAQIPEWERSGGEGGPRLSARVEGRDALEAIRRFAGADSVKFSAEGARRHPVLDYDVPGREACVWQSGGVWVELWAPDEVPARPEPAQAPSAPTPALTSSRFAVRLFGPSGRLPIRRSKTKETTTS